jgi:hypothetical protein
LSTDVAETLSTDATETIVKDFIQHSKACVETIVNELNRFEKAEKAKTRLFHFRNKRGNEATLDNKHFFIRASVEYSNPQVTLEEVQGIVAARLLEVCGTYFHDYGLHEVDDKDINQICEMLKTLPKGVVKSFLLNTDDVEPDRYSANPLRESIVSSGQSAFPSASVRTSNLVVDPNFVRKYEGILISQEEIELITRHLATSNNVYVDMVDAVKYEQLENLSESFGIDLCIDSVRMPLALLERETNDDLLHHAIREVHRDADSVERAYNCMGRSIQKRTTLLTVPHSEKGYGSKRCARGRIYFDGKKLKAVHVDYRTTRLYENDVDPNDVSVAKAEDGFTVEGESLADYSFKETPSSPQFFLYALASPENAAVWHGVGVQGAPQLLKSITTMRLACAKDELLKNLTEGYGVYPEVPLNFNLVPKHMWMHPIHHNIDASVGCVQNLTDLARTGVRLEFLPHS